ncbi:VaFE repeat-containing surface-anchored protein [Enterococcus raffinosus]|uniref:VaFE repeat-containing surface-anchored protein n=1 Tax=Enterococcus raffinosus TaxID=71452 RepID=UPI001C0F7629|nr:VaFE repeat-containing surface-anchored protein [Enterococcus raffinosus]MBU5362537.1 VaFE repeat-containing surface-anchored protein [Enterococcus raffinosus]
MKKFLRGKLPTGLALAAILANTLMAPVTTIAEETTGEEKQAPRISLQNLDTAGKESVESEETFNATLSGEFENVQDASEKTVTFTLNSEFALGENPVSQTAGVKIVKLTDSNFSLDFSEVTEDKHSFAVDLPLTAKVDSANDEAQLVLSSDYTQDIAKTFKITKAPILTQQDSSSIERGSINIQADDGVWAAFGGDRGFKLDLLDFSSSLEYYNYGTCNVIDGTIQKREIDYDRCEINIVQMNGTNTSIKVDPSFYKIEKASDYSTTGMFTVFLNKEYVAQQKYGNTPIVEVKVKAKDGSECILRSTGSRGGKGSTGIKIKKESVDGNVSNITFEVYLDNDNTHNKLIFRGNTNADGELIVGPLLTDAINGKYSTLTVKEIVPEGYEDQQPQTQQITVDSTSFEESFLVFTFVNVRKSEKKGSLKITKVDSVTDSKKLAGATFKITNTDTKAVWLAESKPTASNGELTITDIPIGNYELEEVKAPDGYDLSKEKLAFKVTEGNAATLQTFDFKNTETETPKGKLQITKVDSVTDSKKLAGATFKITNTDTKAVWLAESEPTASNGELTISDIPIGKYELEEVKAPEGYDVSKEKLSFEVTAGNAATLQTFNFKNTETETPLGKVKITKIDSVTASKKLAGATFKITDTDKNTVWLAESKPTASNGELTITDIPVGKYELEEVKAPEGYDVSKEKLSFEVTAGNAATLQTFNFKNTETENPKGKVSILKYDLADSTKKSIAGAKFTLYEEDGKTEVATKTSEDGKLLVFDNLPLGKYVLKETEAPAGYEKASYTKEIEITENNLELTIEVSNKKPEAKVGKVSIQKYDLADSTKKSIAGAKFTLYEEDGKTEVATKTSEAGKLLVFDNLPLGKYVLKETEAPAGYEKASYTKEIEITENDLELTIEVSNKKSETPKGNVTIKKTEKGDDNKALIADAEFTLTDSKGVAVTKTTVAGKELVFDNLELGEYTLEETSAPAGYEKPDFKQTFEVKEGTLSFTYDVENVKSETPKGNVTIKKTEKGDDNKALIADAEFTLTDSKGVAVTKKTVAGKELVFDNLELGEYTLEETSAPAGYEKPDFKQTFEVKEGTLSFTYDVENVKSETPKGKVSIKKHKLGDEDEKLIADAEFTLTDSEENVVDTKTTKEGEELVFDNLEYGEYTLEETSAPAGYETPDFKETFEVKADKLSFEYTVYNKETSKREVGKVTIKKHKEGDTDNKLIADAEFTLTDSEGNEVAKEKTKAGEELVFNNLTYGEYTLEETSAPTGYEKPDFKETFEVKADDLNFEYTVYNKQIPDIPEISTTAKDKETGTNEGYADEKVTIVDKVEYQNLEVGKTYTVKGTLMDQATGKAFVTKDGNEIHAKKDFEAKTKDGFVELEFVITNGDLKGKTVVVFEDLYDGEKKVATHSDINDKNQSVDYPKVGTKASESTVGDKIVVKDIVSYEKLTVGKEYTVEGKLMDKATGKAFEVEGTAVTAKATFKPEAENGTTEVTFEFDKAAIEGKEISLVVFEKVLNADGKVIGTHEDLKDKDQTVEFGPDTPEIATSAKDGETGTNEGYADEKVTIIDKVTYKNLTIGKTYTVKGVLMDKQTGKAFVTKDGNEVHAEKEFTADKSNGSVELEFVVTNGDLAGKTVVVFENMYHEDVEVAAHTDIEDKEQSVDYPKVGTKASESTVGDKIIVKDIVSYEKLTAGKEYTVEGKLMDKETGKAFEVDGVPVTTVTKFTPEAENGTTEVTFEFDKKAIEGKEISLVVFEKVLNADGKVIGTHEDLEDPDQTVEFGPDTPEIATTAKDSETGDHEGYADEQVSIIDTVEYKNLTIGKTYTVKGVLMDKGSNQPFITRDGNEVHAEKEFVAESTNGSVDLEFVITNGDLAGKTVVVFENLFREDKQVASHTDINDKDQSVDYPKVGTKASESTVGDKIIVKDIVSYEKLTVGKAYTVKGTLMDKATGKAFEVDGKAVTAETTFTPDKAAGTTEVTFEFDKKAVEGKAIALVVFEKVYNAKGQLIGSHEDLEDKDQTVSFTPDTPEIATKAKDKGTAGNEGQAKKEVTIIDEVSYKNLIVGKEYTVKGVLMDKATNKPLLANGKEVHAEKTFTAKKPNGTVDLEFTFDGSALAGTTVVVFETLYTDNKEVATHADINDKDQTVTYPKVGTKASDSLVNDNVVIKDMVSYENLVVGNKYTVKGVLMDKSTGLAYLVDGKKVLGETTFVAAQTSGTVEVTFEFAKSALTKKETLVVFEQLFNSKGYLIATHEDINDKDQTVEVGDDTPGKPGLPSTGTGGKTRTYDYSTSTSRGSLPKTGTQNNPLFLVLGVIIIGTVLTMYLVYTRRAKRNH